MARSDQQSRIVDELLNLATARRLLADLHAGQQRCIWARDVDGRLADMVALLSGRRFGKTEGVLRYAIAVCLAQPYSSVLYVSMQRTSAKSIAWPLLESLARRYNIRFAKADSRELYVEFENGSRIILVGADHPKFARLLLGTQHDLVLVDEAQDFIYMDLKDLIDNYLGATLDDREGRMFLTGTPGPVEAGYFWEVVVQEAWPEWAVVHGAPFENPHTRRQQQKKLDRYKRGNADIEQEPWIQRRFFGRWVADNRDRVVQLHPSINYVTEWSPQPGDEFVLSIDFGFSTSKSAYVLSVWNPKRHNDYYYLEGWERGEMMLADHLAAIRSYLADPMLAGSLFIQADPAGSPKALVEELRRTYDLPIHNVEKSSKESRDMVGFTISQLNMDASLGRLKIYNRHNPEDPAGNGVAKQWNALGYIKNPRTQEKELARPRDIHDAAVYARRRMHPELYEDHPVIELTEAQQIRNRKERRARGRLLSW